MVTLSNFAAAALLAMLARGVQAVGDCTTGTIKVMDFDTLARGDYVTNQFISSLGVNVTCDANKQSEDYGCRVFDTAVPVANWGNGDCQHACTFYTFSGGKSYCENSNVRTDHCGDPDLGSPNIQCDPSGPGLGDGGVPTLSNGTANPNANCEPLGKILIIDENGPDYPPDDNNKGGNMYFHFDTPVSLINTTILDNQGTEMIIFRVRRK